VRASLLAGACCLVLATRVFVAYDPIRIKMVEAPVTAIAGVVRVDSSDERAADLRPPFAVIARIRHDSQVPQPFSIRIDNCSVCDATLAGGVAHRVDCIVEHDSNGAIHHELVIKAPTTPWTLEYLELATHHGHATGGMNAFVLPGTSDHYRRPDAAWLLVIWVALTGLLLLPRPRPMARAITLVSRALAAPVAVLFTLVLIAPIVSPYRIVLSAWTFAGWLCLPLAPPLAHWLWTSAGSRRAAVAAWSFCRTHDRPLAWALSAAICGLGLTYGTRALGGADTYGYLSEADLWLRGNLKVDQSFAKEAPWPDAAWSFAPLGYRPHPKDDRVLVPIYSPGLPMLLAAAKRLGGPNAMYYVVPLCAGLLVLATHGLGRRLGSGAVGLIGAWLVATSPVVLMMTMATLTDVPVAAAWAAAFYFLLGRNSGSAVGAGLLSSAAILIRPNLAPLAAVMGLLYIFRTRDAGVGRRSLGHLLVFGMTVLPGVVAVAVINQHLFGSPLISGYGKLEDLFVWSRVPANLRNYIGWLVDAHTPVALCGLVAIFFPFRRLWPQAGDRSIFVIIGIFVVTLWGIYCAWLVFHDWWFSRFLLSSWPFIMLGVGAVAAALFRTAVPFIKPAVVASVIVLGVVQLRFAEDHHAFQVGRGEGRNIVVAQLVQRVTEPNSVILSMQHSGSIRYYAGRMTLNYVYLDGKWLDGAVDWLSAHGVHTYAALEDWEMPEFQSRFAGARRLAAVKQPPVGIYDQPGKLLIFDVSEPNVMSAKPVVATGLGTGPSPVLPAPLPQLAFRRVP
jgi:hypothetical protein